MSKEFNEFMDGVKNNQSLVEKVKDKTQQNKMKQIKYKYMMIWEILRYDIPRFFWNLWLFRKALLNYRWYSGHHAVLPFMDVAFRDIADRKEKHGFETDITANNRIAMMRQASRIINHFVNDSFIEMAENELGPYTLVDRCTPAEKVHRRTVYDRTREIEEEMWIELWEIVKGREFNETNYDEWEKHFDGTGMRGWCD